jgi:Mn2+/Fe2+ NRAMP family transporter
VLLALGGQPDWSGLSGLADAPRLMTAGGIAFLLALVGWMPIPIEVAAWHSLWTRERAQQTGQLLSVRNAIIDFRIGFLGATVLACAFVLLGATLMHASGLRFADSAVAFSAQLVDLYARNFGAWSRPVIAVAALSAMFSTTLAVADAYPRVLSALLRVARHGAQDPPDLPGRRSYLAALVIVSAGALLILYRAGAGFTRLIDFATTLSFLSAPLLAWITLRAVTGPHMPVAARPGRGLLALAWISLAFGVAFSMAWLAWLVLG